jgi:hypothetical protein
MVYQRLGHGKAARACFDRAVTWPSGQHGLDEEQAQELAAFRAEAGLVLGGSGADLPADVFAQPHAF